jgi:hypothetical protein
MVRSIHIAPSSLAIAPSGEKVHKANYQNFESNSVNQSLHCLHESCEFRSMGRDQSLTVERLCSYTPISPGVRTAKFFVTLCEVIKKSCVIRSRCHSSAYWSVSHFQTDRQCSLCVIFLKVLHIFCL